MAATATADHRPTVKGRAHLLVLIVVSPNFHLVQGLAHEITQARSKVVLPRSISLKKKSCPQACPQVSLNKTSSLRPLPM